MTNPKDLTTEEELVNVLDLGTGGGEPAKDDLLRPRTLGAIPKTHIVSYERDLTEADMAATQLPRNTKPASLVRIHASHHALARCLATGMKVQQAALVTGYSPVRVSQLLSDPAFSALVADYRSEAKSVFADFAERMHTLSLDAIELIHERLQDSPGEISTAMLLDIVKACADRTGYGPGQEIHHKMSMNLIDRPPRETFEEWERRRTLELEPVPEPKKLN